jgi:hypothetical protein
MGILHLCFVFDVLISSIQKAIPLAVWSKKKEHLLMKQFRAI